MFLRIVVALAMMPIIVHSLGDRMYGFWVLVGTFLGYYGLFDFGLSSAVARFLSRAAGQEDENEANRVVNTALAIFSLIGLAVLVLSGLAAVLCGHFIHDSGEAALFRKLILLLGVSVAVGFPMRVFGGVLDAHLRHDMTTYASVIRLLASNVAIYLLLRSGYGIYVLAVVSFCGGMAEYLMLYGFARRVMPKLRIRRSFYDGMMVRQLFGYSGKAFIVNLADILRFRIDSLVIAGALNVSLITHYSVGARLVDYFSQIMISAVGLLDTVFSRYEGKGDYEAIRKMLFFATKISVMLSVFIGLSILFYGRQFIQRWMGPGFEDSYIVAAILACAYIFSVMQTPSLNMLYGISKHHYFAAINTCEGVLNLIASLILVRHYGIYGVALGTAISMGVMKIMVQPYFVCKCVDVKVTHYYKAIALWMVKSAVPVIIFMYFIRMRVTADYVNVSVFVILQAIFFATSSYFIILKTDERNMIKRMITTGAS